MVLCDGTLVAYLRRGNSNLQAFLPENDPARTNVARALAQFLAERVRTDREDDPAHRAGPSEAAPTLAPDGSGRRSRPAPARLGL